MSSGATYEEACARRGLIAPPGLTEFLNTQLAKRLEGLLYRPDAAKDKPRSLDWAFDLMNDSVDVPPPNLLPLLPVDESSIACVVCSGEGEPQDAQAKVIRWHLNDVPERFQGACLDNNPALYLQSVAEELIEREWGLRQIRKQASQYKGRYGTGEKRPPGWETRPVQIACQNVIVGLAAFAHDRTFDGLKVPIYLTCEVPHLATHEANRALSALMLCDAFQNGGTMEIRFGKFGIPPALRRFGRSLDIDLGATDPNIVDPAEARDLFLAVTPMPSELWSRVVDIIDRGVISPERLCYSLLAPVWPAIELDYLLATSSRVSSILQGGASFDLRRARLAELESSRAAHMLGMLFRRLDNKDGAVGEAGRVFEDTRAGVEWTIDSEKGVVTFTCTAGNAPWIASPRAPVTIGENGVLHVIPRALPVPTDHELVAHLKENSPDSAALLVPADMANTIPAGIPILLCPDRLGEVDVAIEKKFQSSRVGRV